MNRDPGQRGLGLAAQVDQGHTINNFNYRTRLLAADFTSTYPDAILFEFQTNQVFSNILGDPARYPQSSIIKNVTLDCPAYTEILPMIDYFNASCGVPLREYFWLNALHPTYTVHDALAAEVAKVLING